MTERPESSSDRSIDRMRDDLGYDFEGTRRWQITLGLALTPAERLQWLEETVAEMQTIVGLARKQAPKDPKTVDTAKPKT